jgi:integrase
MARTINQLTARTVATLTKPGRHGDGGGLYLSISPTGAKSWTFIYRFAGKRSEIGFGPARDVPLATARERAAEARKKLEAGQDPKQARRIEADSSFRACAERLIARLEPSWRSDIHAQQWKRSVFADAAALGDIPVDQITTQDVLRVLTPLWQAKRTTAERLRGRIETVLDAAKAEGLRDENLANPARWRGHLAALLPKPKRIEKPHHAAMSYDQVPAFVAELRTREGGVARALEFCILTAARTGEVIGARWSEFDLVQGVWTIPGIRMKSGQSHRVPLSPRALEIVAGRLAGGGGVVFAVPPKALLRVVEKRGVTVHGFRSAFRDWAGDRTHFDREVCEAALAHAEGNRVVAAYRRGDAFEKRWALMTAWSEFCAGQTPANVVAFTRAA